MCPIVVKLLLLLSALLSALGGGTTSARASLTPAAVSRAVAQETAERATRVAFAARAAVARPMRRAEPTTPLVAWRLVPAMPLFASRRRE